MDQREDTGNYYPGGIVVPGTPVPAPGASVNVVSPDAYAKAGDAADAKAVYEGLEKKADKAELHPCTVETTDSEIIITPTKHDVVSGGFYADGAIKSEEETASNWEANILTIPVLVSWVDIETGDYFFESSEATIDFNGKISITQLDDGGHAFKARLVEDVPIMDISYFNDQIGHIPMNFEIYLGSYMDNTYFSEIGGWNLNFGYVDGKSISYDGGGTIPVYFNRMVDIISPRRNIIFNIPSVNLRDNSFSDFTVKLNRANANTADVAWRGLSGMIEKFPGASRMIPGTNVWRVTSVGNGLALIDRNTNSADGVLTSPSGRKAELALNDDMTLEVKEI